MDENDSASQRRPVAERVGTGIAVVLLVVIPLVGMWAMVEIFPGDVPEKANPSYLDVIFQSRFVVFATRLVLLSAALVLLLAAIYVASSMVVRIKRGQWLRRVGPFESEISEVREGLADAGLLLEGLHEAWDVNEELERRLEERDVQLADAHAEIERFDAEITALRRAQGLEPMNRSVDTSATWTSHPWLASRTLDAGEWH